MAEKARKGMAGKSGEQYPRDSPFDLEAFLDSDYARASLDKKSTPEGCQFLEMAFVMNLEFKLIVEQRLVLNGCLDWIETTVKNEIQASGVGRTYYWLSKAVWMDLFWDSAKVKTVNEDVQIRALIDGKKIIVTEASIRHDLQLQDAKGTTSLPNDTIFEELARMGFVQVFVNHQLGDMSHHKKIFVTPSFTKKVFANMKREGKGFSGIITPLFETIMVQALEKVGEEEANIKEETEVPHTKPQTEESVPTTSNEPLPNGEDRMQLTELMNLCTNLQKQVLDLEKAKIGQAKEIEDASKQGRMIDNIDQNEAITLVDETQRRMNKEEMFKVNDLDGDEIIMDATAGEKVDQSTKVAEKEVSTVDLVTTASEVVTTAVDIEVTIDATTLQISKDELTLAQTLIEIKNDQIAFDEEVARNLEAQMKAKMEEEERIAREKDEANIAVIEQWDEVHAKTDTDIELAQKLQTKEQEQLIDTEKARLSIELLEKRRKFFARKREIEKRNRPPTKAQQRDLMCTYLKNMDGWKLKNLKKKDSEGKVKENLSRSKYGNTRLEDGYERVLWGDLKVVNAVCHQLVLLEYKVTTTDRVTTADRVTTVGWIKTEMA
nr:hypothetical protein [Tanacetum cinerariifolium]